MMADGQAPAGFGRRTALAAAAAAVTIGTARAQAGGPVVEVGGGKLRGAGAGGVSTFKGIPYAASTAGANRFLPPQPPAPWPGMRDATAFGRSAPQLAASTDALSAWYNALEPTGEDCLSLNVWTPGTGRRQAPGHGLAARRRLDRELRRLRAGLRRHCARARAGTSWSSRSTTG